MEDKFLNKESCPVQDILSLVKQDDAENLRNTLLDVIDAAYPDGEIYLYEQGYSVYQSEGQAFSPILLACRSYADNCIERSESIKLKGDANSIYFNGFKYLPTDDYVQVFPVESERKNRGLLITINKNVINDQYIDALLDAYNNQIHLLRNKDSDSLTGLYNRQSFDSKIAKIHSSYGSDKRSSDAVNRLCFALLDIDFFKKVNDKYGHVYGDEVLLLFANIMKQTFRDDDLLFRYGGEEFAVLLNNITLDQADSVLNRFRKNIEEFKFPMDNVVTTSIGYCDFNNSQPISTIIERADKALYYSKENGRNMVVSFEELLKDNKTQDLKIDDGDIELF